MDQQINIREDDNSALSKLYSYKDNNQENINHETQLKLRELRETITNMAITQRELTTILDNYRTEKEHLKNQLFQSNHTIGQMYASNSWRITFPIRWISLKIKSLLRKIKTTVKIIHNQGIKSFIFALNNKYLHKQNSTQHYFVDIKEINPNHETILIVSHEASRTGAPILALNIIQELNKKYNIVIMLLGPGGLLNDFMNLAKITICTSQHERYDSSIISLILGELLKLCKIKFAIVNSIESRTVLPCLAKSFIPTISLIHEFASYTRPSSAISEGIFWAYKSVFSAKIVWENAATSNSEIRNRPAIIIPQGKCKLPIQIDNTSYAHEKTKILNTFRPENWPQDTKIILGIGSVHIRKGVDLFLACAKQVLQMTNQPCRFVWIGHGFNPEYDSAYSVYLEDQIKRAQLEQYFTFINEIENLEIAFYDADIFVLSSRLDPLPNVAIDAMTYGLPIVCFDKTTGIADILHEHGLSHECVAEYLDTHDIAKKVQRLLNSPEIKNNISNQIKKIAAQLFNMSNYINAIEEIALNTAKEADIEKEDAKLIANSELLRLDFFSLPEWKSLDRITNVKYFNRGMTSGLCMRKPFPGFHPGIYWDEHKNQIANTNPLAHFIRAGKPDGPWLCEVITPSNSIKKFNSLKSIALHLHVYYPDLLDQIICHLNANEFKPHLLISVPSLLVKNLIKNTTKQYQGEIVDIQIVPNIGRDIGPFLTTFGKTLSENYEIIGHFHTKKTLAYNDKNLGKKWFSFLLENLIGGTNQMLDRILTKINEDPTIGIIFPDDPFIVGWSANYIFAESLAKQMNISKLPQNYFNFPVGTMFWARTAAIKPLIDLNLGWNDYPQEPIPADGTLLHAIERLLPFIAMKSGFRYALTNVPGVTR